MDASRSPADGCPVLSYSPHERRPIGDWAAFFDQLRADAPVVRNTFADGYYVLTGYEDILAAYQDPETFSTDAVTVFEPDPSYRWIPHMLGGDEHRQWRRLLGPAFAPKAVAVLDDRIRVWAAELIDAAGRPRRMRRDRRLLVLLPDHDLPRADGAAAGGPAALHGPGKPASCTPTGRRPEEIADNRMTAMAAVFDVFPGRHRRAPRAAGRRPDQPGGRVRDRRAPGHRRRGDLLLLLHVHGGPRHGGGRVRLRAVPLRHPPGRPAADRRRPGPHPGRDRGDPAGLRLHHPGPQGQEGHRGRRLPDCGRLDGAAADQGGDAGSARVPGRGGGQDRPHAQQPHRVRGRPAPVPRLPPGPP